MSGIALVWIELGDPGGSPILALHGAANTKEVWRRIATEGLPQRRWICPDLRGHGDSPSEVPWTNVQRAHDLVALLDRLGLERVDCVGQSLGAVTAAGLCRVAPERVEDVVLLDPPVLSREEFDASFPPSAAADGAPEYDTVEEAFAARADGGGIGRLPPEAMEQALREEAARYERTAAGRLRPRADRAGLAAAIRDLRENETPISLGRFQGRVLHVLAARADLVGPVGGAAFRAELGSRVTTVVLDSSHAVLLEAYPETTSALARFLERHPAAQTPRVSTIA